MKKLKNAIATAISLISNATNFAQETGVKINGVTWATCKVGAPTHLSPIRELDEIWQRKRQLKHNKLKIN